MAMILNLPGAIKEVRTSTTNREIIESLNRFTEEFYKTVGILLYTRCKFYIDSNEIEPDRDLFLLIEDHFEKPTYDSWMRLGKNSATVLSRTGDKLALRFSEPLNRSLDQDSNTTARNILKEIHLLLSNQGYRPPKKCTLSQVLEIMRLLRNFRSHEWDNNFLLQSLVDTGIQDFIVKRIDEIFSNIEVEILKPISIKRDYIETYFYSSAETKVEKIPKSSICVNIDDSFLDSTFLRFGGEEQLFEMMTKLAQIDENTNRLYLYSKMKKNSEAVFISLPLTGEIKTISRKHQHFLDLFGLPHKQQEAVLQNQTLVQKFGEICEENNIIHNLPELTPNYIVREKIENDLLNKLSHQRLYITTLDGGGGFGKTDLAKKVIWKIIKGEVDKEIEEILNFDCIIWISGKITYFNLGSIEEKEQSFDTLDDLLDCVFYITNNLHFLNQDLNFKKQEVIHILKSINSTLIILDNLETTSQKDEVWEYLIRLGDKVTSNIKILITSRVLGTYAVQRLNVRSMEYKEAKLLILNEIERLDVDKRYKNERNIKDISELSGRIPLLIIYFVRLLSRGLNLSELKEHTPKESENAFNFICSFQWNELSPDARKLLMGISKKGGKVSFAEAKLLCTFTDSEFQDAKEELQNRSFLVDTELINSLLVVLPPINKFVSSKLQEFPEIDEELNEGIKLIEIPSQMNIDSGIQTLLYTDEIALNQIFQRADLLIRRGAIDEAYRWYQQAVSRFPENVLSWRTIGDFEFKHLEDDEKAKKSFEKAINLNPKDDVTYRMYAYWQYDRGAKNSRKTNLTRSIDLNHKALGLVDDEGYKRIIKDHIASSLMKLGYIHRDEARKNNNQKTFDLAHQYFKNVVDLLSDNIVCNPKRIEEFKHNALDYNVLANACLMIGGKNDKNRKWYDFSALDFLIKGLKLKNENQMIIFDQSGEQLKYTLRNPIIKKLFREFDMHYDRVDDGVIDCIIEMEDKIYENLCNINKV